MRSIQILIMLGLLCCNYTVANAGQYWVEFSLQQQPLCDSNGRIVSGGRRVVFAKKLRNIRLGGEWVCPDLSEYNVIERRQRDGILIVLFEADSPPPLDVWSRNHSYRKRIKRGRAVDINHHDYVVATRYLTGEEAQTIKDAWGFQHVEPPEPPESGVSE